MLRHGHPSRDPRPDMAPTPAHDQAPSLKKSSLLIRSSGVTGRPRAPGHNARSASGFERERCCPEREAEPPERHPARPLPHAPVGASAAPLAFSGRPHPPRAFALARRPSPAGGLLQRGCATPGPRSTLLRAPSTSHHRNSPKTPRLEGEACACT
jgi:hypothetical protein